MHNKTGDTSKEKNTKTISPTTTNRRKVVKTIVGGAAALAGYNALPAKWGTPIIEQIVLPVHAQTSAPAVVRTYSITIPDDRFGTVDWICVTVTGTGSEAMAQISTVGDRQQFETYAEIPAPGSGPETIVAVGNTCAPPGPLADVVISSITDAQIVMTIGPYTDLVVPAVSACIAKPALTDCSAIT